MKGGLRRGGLVALPAKGSGIVVLVTLENDQEELEVAAGEVKRLGIAALIKVDMGLAVFRLKLTQEPRSGCARILPLRG